MRLFGFSASLLGAIALIQGVVAQDTTLQSTFTLWRTVMRVEATTTATASTKVHWPSSVVANPTGIIPYAHNGTASTGGLPSYSAPAPVAATGAASNVIVDTIGMAAVAGLVGAFAL